MAENGSSRTGVLAGLAIAGLATAVGLGYFLWFELQAPHQPTEPLLPKGAVQLPIGPPPQPPKAVLSTPSPMTGVVVGKAPGEATLSLTARRGPVRILGIRVTPATPHLKIDTTSPGACHPKERLGTGEVCAIALTWTPAREGEFSRQLILETTAKPASLAVEIRGTAIAPPLKVAKSSPPAPPPPAPSFTYPLSNIEAINARATPITAIRYAPKPPPRPKIADWSSLGIKRFPSSPPVDMARVIPEGSYIPAVLETPIDSRIPGPAAAIVERNVYGGTGRTVIIPAGSRITGAYSGGGKIGNERVTITWDTITLPNGVRFTTKAVAGDAMGQIGVVGKVDERLWQKYGVELLTTMIEAGATLALGGETVTNSGFGGTSTFENSRAMAAQQVSQGLANLAQQYVQDHIDMRPIVSIPAGTRITIIPAADLWLREPWEPDIPLYRLPKTRIARAAKRLPHSSLKGAVGAAPVARTPQPNAAAPALSGYSPQPSPALPVEPYGFTPPPAFYPLPTPAPAGSHPAPG